MFTLATKWHLEVKRLRDKLPGVDRGSQHSMRFAAKKTLFYEVNEKKGSYLELG